MLHPADETPAVANLANQVGAVRSVGNAYLRLRLPSRVCWFTFRPGPRTGSSGVILQRGPSAAAPLATTPVAKRPGFRDVRDRKSGASRFPVCAVSSGRGEAPFELDRAVDPEHLGELLGDLQLAAGLDERVVDHLAHHLRVVRAEDHLCATGKDGVRHAE